MSRIGNMPIIIPKEVTITVTEQKVSLTGPKGQAEVVVPAGLKIEQKENVITVITDRHDKAGKSLHGYLRAQIQNDVTGLTKGFTKTLEMVGVGYRAAVTGVNLVLNVGFSHSVTVEPPTGVTFKVEEGKILVSGANRQVVGQVAANIRAIRPPEPYKGKGIRLQGEYVRKKAGKAAKAAGGTK
jgi:large subunit ribosomal protein L6